MQINFSSIWVSLGILLQADYCLSGPVVAEGYCDWKTHRADGSIGTNQAYFFRAILSESNYQFSTTPIDLSDNFTECVGYDGRDNYLFRTTWPTGVVENIERPSSLEAGYVSPGAFPRKGATALQIAWFGLWGPRYFTGDINTEYFPIYCVQYTPSIGISNIITRSGGGRIESITLFSPGLFMDGANESPLRAAQRLQPPNDKGYRAWNIQLKWDSNDRKNSSVPTEFHFFQYLPVVSSPQQKDGGTILIRSGHYFITNVLGFDTSLSDFRPPLPSKPIQVFDTRVDNPRLDGQIMSYSLVDAKWKNRADAALKAEMIRLNTFIVRGGNSQKAKPNILAAGLVAIAFAFPLAISAWLMRKKRKTVKSKTL